MSSQIKTLEQAVVGLLNAVTVAQQRGAFNLEEAATIFQAYNIVKNFHQTTLNKPALAPAPAPAETPVETQTVNV